MSSATASKAPARSLDADFSYTGQLIEVVADARRPDNGDTIGISRPGASFEAVEAAL